MITKQLKYKIKLARTKKDLLGILDVQTKTWIETYANKNLGITKSMISDHYKHKITKEYIKERYRLLNTKDSHNWIAFDSCDRILGWIGCTKEGSNKGGFGIYVFPNIRDWV